MDIQVRVGESRCACFNASRIQLQRMVNLVSKSSFFRSAECYDWNFILKTVFVFVCIFVGDFILKLKQIGLST